MSERCGWAGGDPLYEAYHDEEWGVPERDPIVLWEKLTLEGFQAGLSWITILKKRENFRQAFAQFDPQVVAGWGADEINQLLQNPGIVRHRGKIEATITNAQAFLRINEREGFDTFLWKYVDGRPVQNTWTALSEVPAKTSISDRLSKDLKAEGFKFCGPTIIYAAMQAMGMVNDHLVSCPRHAVCAALA